MRGAGAVTGRGQAGKAAVAAVLAVASLAAALAAACRGAAPSQDLSALGWEEIAVRARGSTLTMTMWQGDPYINAYMNGYVVPALKRDHDITLKLVGGQGSQITAMLMTEIEADQAASAIDMVWINGETFFQLRRIGALYGPFTDRLPNARYIDLDDPFIRYDFQQEIHGYECPWGNVQLCLIYDTGRVSRPPMTREELALWVSDHPGRFTFDNAFTGMTFLKAMLIDLAGGEAELAGPFDERRYIECSTRLWDYINGIKRFFWKQGETFPVSVAQLHQLFVGGEVDFTMSNNDGEVDNKVLQGLFPDTARAYVPSWGSIQNSHYVGIVSRSAHVAAALVAVNFLISPEAQLEKMKPQVWGDGTVLAVDKLPPVWQARFKELPLRRHAPQRSEIQARALRELDPQYMIRLYEDFRSHVVAR